MLENLRLAVRSQLGFTSIRLPSSGRHGNVWRRLFNFTRSRRSASLALVSSGVGPEPATAHSPAGSVYSPERPDSDDSESEQQGAVGGASAPVLPHKTPPVSGVPSVSGGSAPRVLPESDITTAPTALVPGGRGSLVSRGLRWVRASLGSRFSQQQQQQLEEGAASDGEDDEDVELLVPLTDTPEVTVAPRGRPTVRDGPCEHCGMVHTAQIPPVCLEATAGRTESSDDDSLLLC